MTFFLGFANSLSVVNFGGGSGGYQDSIDNLMVYKDTERPVLQVEPSEKLASTWAYIKLEK